MPFDEDELDPEFLALQVEVEANRAGAIKIQSAFRASRVKKGKLVRSACLTRWESGSVSGLCI